MYQTKFLETIAVLLLYIIAYLITAKVINNALKNAALERARRKNSIKAINALILLGCSILIAGIWGLKQNEIAVFASTLFTALGIGFFAQWSLLSNITSSILLFFNHPMKLGDHIKVLDKDYPFEGEIIELTYFFIHLKDENGKTITIPNSTVLQKPIALTTNKPK